MPTPMILVEMLELHAALVGVCTLVTDINRIKGINCMIEPVG